MGALRGGARIGVAVSGGSDSCALLHLMQLWAQKVGVTLSAVTVDHGLRKAAVEEAKTVAKTCAGLGVEHTVLKWADWDGKGNLQDQARQARYRLMAQWGAPRGISTIALGHTLEDQAETFLMRLARGSGVDGLSGMAQLYTSAGIDWLRPVLLLERQHLRDYLSRHQIGWIEDPSNQDERFDRVKARKILKVLAPLGIDAARLASTASALQPARQALEVQTQAAARQMVTVQAADVVFDPVGFGGLHPEIQSRLLSHALRWVSSSRYPPRRAALQDLQAAVLAGKSSTLHGCRIITKTSEIRIGREYQAIKDMSCATGVIWDRHWQLSGPDANDFEIRALGAAGLLLCPDWRAAELPRISLLASPAVWQNQTLIAAPLARLGNEWQATARFGLDHFISSLLSH
ncbi:hypothetical protein JI58_00085 [Marinosulfonomonas sp. PRT-SC04]|nr:hypothetical protein JI58_00085 [Marinosulfonomonas sp. PRT-SC04]